MAPGRIGQPMQSAQPEVIQSQPTRGYWESRRQWDREVKEAIEGPLPATGIAPGTYSPGTITVGTDGRITAASSDQAPRTRWFSPQNDKAHDPTGSFLGTSGANQVPICIYSGAASASQWLSVSLPGMETGDRVTQIIVDYNNDSAPPVSAQCYLYAFNASAGGVVPDVSSNAFIPLVGGGGRRQATGNYNYTFIEGDLAYVRVNLVPGFVAFGFSLNRIGIRFVR